MDFNIKVVDYMNAFQVVYNQSIPDDFAIISIRDNPIEESGIIYQAGGKLKAALNLYFLDINQEKSEFGKGFSKKDAKEIRDFVERLIQKNKIKTLLIHCRCGVSRSAAVAAAISRIYYGDDMEYFTTQYTPNMHVYKTLLEEYGFKNTGEAFL